MIPPVADLQLLYEESYQQYQGAPCKGAVSEFVWQDCVLQTLKGVGMRVRTQHSRTQHSRIVRLVQHYCPDYSFLLQQ